MPLIPSNVIEVRRVRGKGRGVFARRPIAEGDEIERAPVLLVADDCLYGTPLADYAFEWSKGKVALALGYGSLYNHSYQPNAQYFYGGPQVKVFYAIRDIAAGEEITINYNSEPTDQSPVWFDVVE
ncbi:SET domain-containing protein-lysine N-methyltransferase [bacterium]|nr:SET domain-containing protein-lysine N-methyltransferase [bacterium]